MIPFYAYSFIADMFHLLLFLRSAFALIERHLTYNQQ